MSYNINQHFFPSTQIYLNSKYADAYGGFTTYKSWCYFNFKEPIVKLPEAYDFLISLSSAEIPCSMYTVNNTNNTIIFSFYNSDDGTNFLVNKVVIPGNYSAIDLASKLTFNDVSGLVITTTYNEINNKFQFSTTYPANINSSAPFHFKIYAGDPNCIFGLSGKEIIQSTPDVSGNFIITSDLCVDLAGTRSIFVKCLNIHTQAFDSRTKYSGTTLGRIPLSQEPFGIVFWNNYTGFKSKCSLKNISNLEIQICDEYGNLIDFNNIDWSLTLQLDILAESPTEYKPDVPFR